MSQLEIKNNLIYQIENGSLNGLNFIDTVYLINNRIQKHPFSFSGMKIQNLYLNGNPYTKVLNNEFFYGVKDLINLVLHDNYIESIEMNTFL